MQSIINQVKMNLKDVTPTMQELNDEVEKVCKQRNFTGDVERVKREAQCEIVMVIRLA